MTLNEIGLGYCLRNEHSYSMYPLSKQILYLISIGSYRENYKHILVKESGNIFPTYIECNICN